MDSEEYLENDKEKSSSSETPNRILAAEDIAFFRTELEQKFFIEGLPKNKWRKFYRETLARYPNILKYKPLLEAVMENVETGSEQLEKLWQKLQKTTNSSAENNTFYGELFNIIFGFYPNKNIEMFKGEITLHVIVEDEDLRKILKYAPDRKLPAATTIQGSPFLFPVLVFRKDTPSKEVIYIHEAEHGKSIYFREAISSLPMPDAADLKELEQSKKAVFRFKRRAVEEPRIEERAKDEILAYFSEIAYVSPHQSLEQKIIEQYRESIKSVLTDEWSGYYPTYQAAFFLSRKDMEHHMSNVVGGIDSIFELYDIYKKLGKDINTSGFMAINVLGQFPLRSWPAVLRLIRSRHKITDTP